MLFSGTICATMAVLLSLLSMMSTTIDNDKKDKYILIGNKSAFDVKEIDSVCVASLDRLPMFCKDGSDSTELHVSHALV